MASTTQAVAVSDHALSQRPVLANGSLPTELLPTTLAGNPVLEEEAVKPKKKRANNKPRKHKKGNGLTAAASVGNDAASGRTSSFGDETSSLTESIPTTPLDEFLAKRPSMELLRQQNILRDAAADEARRTATLQELDKRLQRRPSAVELVEKNVLRGSAMADPGIRAVADAVQRQQNRDHLSRSLRNKPSMEELMRRNIIRGGGSAQQQHLPLSPLSAGSHPHSTAATNGADGGWAAGQGSDLGFAGAGSGGNAYTLPSSLSLPHGGGGGHSPDSGGLLSFPLPGGVISSFAAATAAADAAGRLLRGGKPAGVSVSPVTQVHAPAPAYLLNSPGASAAAATATAAGNGRQQTQQQLLLHHGFLGGSGSDAPHFQRGSGGFHDDGGGSGGGHVTNLGATVAPALRQAVERLSALIEKRPSVSQLLRSELIKNVMMWTQLDITSSGQPQQQPQQQQSLQSPHQQPQQQQISYHTPMNGSAPALPPSPWSSGSSLRCAPPAPRHCSTLTLSGRTLVLLGGLSPRDDSGWCIPYCLDLDASEWYRPTVRSSAGFLPHARYAHSTVAVGPFLLVFGGYGSRGAWLNDVWVLDPRPASDAVAFGCAGALPAGHPSAVALAPVFANAPAGTLGLPPGFLPGSPSIDALMNALHTPAQQQQQQQHPQQQQQARAASGALGDGASASSAALNALPTWYLPPVPSPAVPQPRAAHCAALISSSRETAAAFNSSTRETTSSAPFSSASAPPAAASALAPSVAASTAAAATPAASASPSAMVVFGGNDGTGLFNDTWLLHLGGGSGGGGLVWEKCDPMGTPPSPRSGASAVAAPPGDFGAAISSSSNSGGGGGSQVFIFGGGEGWGAEVFNDLYILDVHIVPPPRRQTGHGKAAIAASSSGSRGIIGAAPAPSPAAAAAAATADASSAPPPSSSSCVWFRPSYTGTAPAPRAGHSAVRLHDSMFVFGGGDARRTFNDLHILHMRTMAWSRPSDSGAVPPPRSGHCAAAVGEFVVIFGGAAADGRCYDDLHILDTDFNLYPGSAADEPHHPHQHIQQQLKTAFSGDTAAVLVAGAQQQQLQRPLDGVASSTVASIQQLAAVSPPPSSGASHGYSGGGGSFQRKRSDVAPLLTASSSHPQQHLQLHHHGSHHGASPSASAHGGPSSPPISRSIRPRFGWSARSLSTKMLALSLSAQALQQQMQGEEAARIRALDVDEEASTSAAALHTPCNIGAREGMIDGRADAISPPVDIALVELGLAAPPPRLELGLASPHPLGQRRSSGATSPTTSTMTVPGAGRASSPSSSISTVSPLELRPTCISDAAASLLYVSNEREGEQQQKQQQQRFPSDAVAAAAAAVPVSASVAASGSTASSAAVTIAMLRAEVIAAKEADAQRHAAMTEQLREWKAQSEARAAAWLAALDRL